MRNLMRLCFSVIILASVLLLPSCSNGPTEPAATTIPQPAPFAKVTVFENFESGTKTSYAAANVTLSTGVWNLNDALLGTLSTDRKNGLQSVRTRYSGKVTMMFNRTDGASTVSVLHAVFGSDASSTWQLWYSTNSGSTWTQAGSTITTSSTTLQTATFTVNKTGTIRFEIRKTDGTANRVNFDDFTINDYTGGGGGSSEHLVLGNPTSANTDTTAPSNYLMVKPQYALSYNRDKGGSNWVAWHLSSAWLGSAPRQDDFRADSTLPVSWYHVQATSYSGSGFDRGHQCPSADRTITIAANSSTFLMTNMLPQSPNLNQGPWAYLEDSCRALVAKGNELYIYSGGYGSQGTINNGHVNVPASCWKVIVVLPNGDNDLSRVTTSTRVIGVWMPNSDGQISRTANWKSYRVSVDYIESRIGYDFLSNVSSSIQSVIEARTDSM